MAEHPPGPESLIAKFDQVQDTAGLIKAIRSLPDTASFLLTDTPGSQNIEPRGKDALFELTRLMHEFAQNSSLCHDTDPASQEARERFLDALIVDNIIDDGPEAHALIGAVRRALIDSYPEYGDDGVAPGKPAEPEVPAVPEAPTEPIPFEFNDDAKAELTSLGWPARMIARLSPEKAEKILSEHKPYIVLKKIPEAPKVAPKVTPADLSKLMPKKSAESAANTAAGTATEVAVGTAAVEAGAAGAGTATGVETVATILDNNPEFRAFLSKASNAEEIVGRQDMAEIGLYKRAFEIKNRLATDLYELANGAIKGDFLLDFENPASNLPKNAKEEFQKYVNAEALERPEQLLNLANQLETRQVLEKNIATAKAEIERLGGKDFFDQAEREALELKQHLDVAHESTRRDSLAGYIPHGLHLGFLKVLYKTNEWTGWQGQTEATIKAEFDAERATLLNGRAEADLMVWEKLRMDKIAQRESERLAGLKRHQALGEQVLAVSQQGVSREKLKERGVNLGLGSLTSYSLFWIKHPDIARELESVNGRLADIRQKKQTIEQAERNFVEITAQFEAIRTSTYAELPPTITLVRYAQAQIKNTLTSFTADTAIEDLERIYDYTLLVADKQNAGGVSENTNKGPFDAMTGDEFYNNVSKLHEAIVAKWGKRIFEVFEKTAINKKGAIGEMEKVVKALLAKESIGAERRPQEKAVIAKNLIVEAFRKIDPTKGDGKERRLALMGVLISCGLLKKGEKITT